MHRLAVIVSCTNGAILFFQFNSRNGILKVKKPALKITVFSLIINRLINLPDMFYFTAACIIRQRRMIRGNAEKPVKSFLILKPV